MTRAIYPERTFAPFTMAGRSSSPKPALMPSHLESIVPRPASPPLYRYGSGSARGRRIVRQS